jgi:hypothetical protein
VGFAPTILRLRSAERGRILLICPDCGQETPEDVDKLRGMTFYACGGDGCDYRFAVAAVVDRGAAMAETAER